MALIIPKCNAESETLNYTLQVYYDANDWVTNADLIDRLSNMLQAAGIENERKEPQSYTKKTQVLSYYGLIEWQDPNSNQSSRRITDYGKSLYEFRKNNEVSKIQDLLVDILTEKTFGRNVLGCDSDSDLEAPNIFVKSVLILNGISNKEFAYILERMEFEKVEYGDVLFEVFMRRKQNLLINPTARAAKWADPKPILALADWGLFNVIREGQSKRYYLEKEVIERLGDKLTYLKIKNTDIPRSLPHALSEDKNKKADNPYRLYITAIKSKPFLLLAGISGTGKSRIVRELARACWEKNSTEYNSQTPPNFAMVQVKPNWHDSTELIGYISRVSGNPIFIPGEFLKFLVKAWEHTEIPYFLCLDEMNLAPVEQYFAEYLSVIESRKLRMEDSNEFVITDPIIEPEFEYNDNGELKPKDWYATLVKDLLVGCPIEKDFALTQQFLHEGISIPQNLIVVGTVNMDETTFSFSRKVLDRAMTIEMNKVDLFGGLIDNYEPIDLLSTNDLVGTAVEGKDVYSDNQEVCEVVISYLQTVNQQLEGTPFKVAYRTRNEFLLYVINNLDYNKDSQGKSLSLNYIVARALDEITSMKILSRIEGDSTKVTDSKLKALIDTIELSLNNLNFPEEEDEIKPELHLISVAKLQEMRQRLNSGYTSFWS